jgi:multiple sugar transport system permease protein
MAGPQQSLPHNLSRRLRDWRRISPGFAFVAPAALILALTSLYPVLYSLALSLFDWKWGLDMAFVGAANYTRLLGDPVFWRVLIQTVYFATGAVAIEMVLGLILALAVNELDFGAGIIRTLLLTPLMVSGIIVALMFKILLDPTLGVVNHLLKLAGLPASPFFGASSTAMPSIIMVDTWWQTAFVFIILLAGLQSLPREPFEAAEVEGANRFQRFRFITLPLLRPVILTVIIFRTIDCLKVFAIVFGTTNGGPDIATEVVQTLTYRTAFKLLHVSEAMTMMVVFSAIILLVCLMYIALGRWAEAVS